MLLIKIKLLNIKCYMNNYIYTLYVLTLFKLLSYEIYF